MIFNLNELDNSGNLEDGRPSNILFTRYVFGFEDLRISNQQHPSTRNLKVARLFP